MPFQPWLEANIEITRTLTRLMRTSDEDEYVRLRRAMERESIDPLKSVLVDILDEQGDVSGIFLGPDGVAYDFGWDSEEVALDVRPDGAWTGAIKVHNGRVLLAEEGTVALDPLDPLVVDVEHTTRSFRTSALLANWWKGETRDWSLARNAISAEGVDPDQVVVITAYIGGEGLGAVFVFPDERVFRFTGELKNWSGDAVRVVEWVQLDEAEIAVSYGGLHEAALRIART